jgi:hypothetical protein
LEPWPLMAVLVMVSLSVGGMKALRAGRKRKSRPKAAWL